MVVPLKEREEGEEEDDNGEWGSEIHCIYAGNNKFYCSEGSRSARSSF